MKITLTTDQAYTIMTACDCARYDEDDNLGNGFEQAFNRRLDRIVEKLKKAIAEGNKAK